MCGSVNIAHNHLQIDGL